MFTPFKEPSFLNNACVAETRRQRNRLGHSTARIARHFIHSPRLSVLRWVHHTHSLLKHSMSINNNTQRIFNKSLNQHSKFDLLLHPLEACSVDSRRIFAHFKASSASCYKNGWFYTQYLIIFR